MKKSTTMLATGRQNREISTAPAAVGVIIIREGRP
jgi:hypothetical protein